MDSFSEANKRLNSYLKQLISEGNLWKPASNLCMWSHQSTRNCASKVLTRIILEFYTKQPGSYPSILVNLSEKPNIHSLKSWRSQWFVSLKQQPRSHKNTNILLEPPGMFIDWACDRQTARLCSLMRGNLKQTNKIEIFRTVFVFLW